MDVSEVAATYGRILDTVGSAVIVDEYVFESIATAFVARGHALVEDVPGTGKTLLARSFATALGLDYTRIQFTPDLLPADITGTHVFNETTGEFTFEPGPIFANVVLADEINRAPPKTQAALLEAMGERQVTVGGETKSLPEPFFVIATQNPVEQEGTFPLPEAQVDRFLIKTAMGYPDRDGELELLDRRANRKTRTATVDRIVDEETVNELRSVPETVRVDEAVCEYLVDVCRNTRSDDRVTVGVSPRGVQRLFEASRVRAALSGRSYVVPDDVHAVVHQVLAHRIVLTTESTVRGVEQSAVVDDAVEGVPIPAMDS